MAIGDWHDINGYRFRETVPGTPFMPDSCVDCGMTVYSVQPTGRINQWGLEEDCGATARARCSTCGRKHYGLPPR